MTLSVDPLHVALLAHQQLSGASVSATETHHHLSLAKGEINPKDYVSAFSPLFDGYTLGIDPRNFRTIPPDSGSYVNLLEKAHSQECEAPEPLPLAP